MRNINEVLSMPEYSFVNEHFRLKDKIAMLTFGGSVAYGLDTPQSDIDVRGIVMPLKTDVLGCPMLIEDKHRGQGTIYTGAGFEQYEDAATDTVIYSFDKAVSLFAKCNPNCIEMLGCKPEHYAMVSPYGQMLIDNSSVFLCKDLVRDKFSGYARGQFQRLKNAIVKDSNSNVFHCINLCDTINRMMTHLKSEYPDFTEDMIKLTVTDHEGNPVTLNGIHVDAYDIGVLFNDSETIVTVNGTQIPDSDVELRFTVHADNITTRTFMGVFNEVSSNIKEFNKHLGNRNKKKDSYHLNKHCMHLIRLYLMAEDILRDEVIKTYRDTDQDFLLSIKNGYFYHEDTNTMSKEFFDLVASYDKRLIKAYEESKLPSTPNYEAINKLVMQIKNRYLEELGDDE